MKLIKLCTHQKSFSTEDLIINPKEHPDIKIGDIVEIYHPDEEGFRLLLQVNDNKDKSGNLTGKDTISVESNIATTFNLRTYANVVIQVVKPSSVALDSVEITFKDQYMGRSEMWRLKSFLTNTCVYLNKKIEYCMGSIRCQVYEMWSQGDRVACGVINEDTKVVFRSSTSMVYLFIQMSSEMWDFDIHGDLYFEKAVNGFLTDLFMKWKKLGSNHEVTIVLFSRTFYNAKSLDEFPAYMQECLHMDHKGRFYEDFYRVAIQNERYDDWSTILVQLRRLFTAYHGIVLRYHERGDLMTYIPNAMNSTAAQGNFLEVLNISLNVFEKHYLDRSFERTGQLSVVITPGVGVFEVDRELTNITKQRIIDNGVGSDLVCVGEQPLHAVPLLKFHNKDASLNAADDYSMPHWINLSFYSTNKKVAYSTFIPRIKLPPLLTNEKKTDIEEHNRIKLVNDTQKNEYIHNSLFDYDAYDAEIFSLPSAHGTCSLQRAPRTKKTSVPSLEGFGTFTSKEWENITPSIQIRRKMSDPDIHHGTKNVLASSQNNSPKISEAMSILEKQNQQKNLKHIGGTIVRPGRALINPFDPSHVTIKLTSNRRRWTHIFPKGPTGVLIQQHHYQAVPTTTVNKSSAGGSAMSVMPNRDPSDYQHTSTCKLLGNGLKLDIGIANAFGEVGKRKISILHSPAGPNVTVTPSKSLTLLWGATGEQEWTPALTTGVDWKSLTIPACLPITTDYFPDNRSLNNDYVVSDYTLLPEDVNADYAHNRGIYKKPLSTEEVFKELVSQRLAQGFQVIVVPDKTPAVNTPQMMKAPCCGGLLHKNQLLPKQKTSILASMAMAAASSEPHHKEYLLSIGRIFHRITLSGSVITVTRYRPRHPYTPLNIDYRYRFQAPQHDTYEVSGVNFTTEKLENFNWNYMDQYICTRGDRDYPLQENLKFWRYRMYLLPKEHPAVKKITETFPSIHCDIFAETKIDYRQVDEFLRFVELYLNKFKQPPTNKQLKEISTVQKSHLTQRRHSTSIIMRPSPNQAIGNSPFRDRLGSNRLPDKRPRSGSKHIEKGPGRISPAAEAAGLNINHVDANNLIAASTAEDKDEIVIPEVKLNQNATLTEIFDAIRNPLNGLSFCGKMPSLPTFTFVANDAINWLKSHIDSTSVNPIEILESMRCARMICHASGDFSKPIKSGFHLYYIAAQDRESKDYTPPLGDFDAFENEWMEVEIKYADQLQKKINSNFECNIPQFLREHVEINRIDGPLYKQVHLDTDIQLKSDRTEWGHLRYHRIMTPGYAYEIIVQWLIASGSILNDLIFAWCCRKAPHCGFQLIPIPADPLAEPFTDKSDPLRGPIFIPLHLDSLKQHRDYLFEEFKKDSWPDRLLLFQESIVQRFGFLPCYVETKIGSNQSSFDHQYVHCTGHMFILVPSPHQGLKIRQRLASGGTMKKPTFINKVTQPNLHAESHSHDSRHTNCKAKDDLEIATPRKIGFLWSWNHMISNKKWKSLIVNNSADGELFQLRMLRDFKDFCTNQDNRLVNYWDECWIAKEKASIKDSTI